MSHELEKLRTKITNIDKEIINLLNNRMKIVLEIAEVKKKNNIAILDKNREINLINSLIEYTKINSLNLDNDFIKELWTFLMNYSKKKQVS